MKHQGKSVMESELSLWEASKRYMKGEISNKDLENIEHNDDADLKKAVLTLGRKKLEQRILPLLKKLKSIFRDRKGSNAYISPGQ